MPSSSTRAQSFARYSALGFHNSAINGTDSALFLFKSAGADAIVSATELTLIGTLQGTAQTALADYSFA